MLNYKEFTKVRDYLYRKTGIYIDDKKQDSFVKKLTPYLQENGYDNFRTFFHTLRFGNNQSFIQDIINLITVNETYFYREKHQFESLINTILPNLHKSRKDGEVIRILCAPSSSGEEPYTIVLNLLDEGTILSQRDIELVGIDIDSKIIKKAKSGIYNKRSVQFIPNNLLRKYFSLNDTSYNIDSMIKNAVNFKVANIMDKNEMRGLGKFDIIFSRNMLIYFDDESRREVGVTFYDLLKPDGYIFLGHADKMSRISSLFSTQKLGKSLVYQKYN
ncbi:MAG: protein-glutamate O-methyltransferase CheR [Campylobacterota bacterium]|nr:protein-glutamate O-methyltransferase CheR [Campylobacterota bacterium]